jgi:transcription antitermination factor NusG
MLREFVPKSVMEVHTMGKTALANHKRRYIRFKPSANHFAQIDLGANEDEFTFQYVGLVVDEAAMGCCLAVSPEVKLKVGDQIRVKVGPLAPLKARVVWKAKLDDSIEKVGFEFLE